MGLYTKLLDGIEEVDVIIAGGGTAACIVASRLADADPDLSILVIEGGSNNYNEPKIIHPIFWLDYIVPTSKASLFYQANEEGGMAGRKPVVPSGGILGGGSSMNMMMYSRGLRTDFDSWKMPGWSTDELLPYLKKIETYQGLGPKEVHGHDGPIQITAGSFHSARFQDDFVKAAQKIGLPEFRDQQNLEPQNGVSRPMRYISADGRRQDTAHAYLHPRLQDGKHPNLHVVVEAQVVRVLFNDEEKKAVGVEYKPNPDFQASIGLSQNPAKQTVKARKMVILSCGALGTPLVLERSGVGNPEVLKRAGIQTVVADVPGVGHEYQDHQLLVYPYRSSLNADETMDELLRGFDPIANNDRRLGWNGQDVGCKLWPSESELATFGPEFQKAWERDFKDNVRPLVAMSAVGTYPGDPTSVPVGQYFAMSAFNLYPYSRGHLHITGPEIGDPLDFQLGIFSDKNDLDVKIHIWGYKKQREIVRRMDTYRGEFAPGHPPFDPDSPASCTETNGPLPADIPDIRYTAEDEAVLAQWLRENVSSTWHSLGTCKMGARDDMGVVDARLAVHGIEGLRIADLSVVPGNVSANTANTAMVVGERAAGIFIEELGLGGGK